MDNVSKKQYEELCNLMVRQMDEPLPKGCLKTRNRQLAGGCSDCYQRFMATGGEMSCQRGKELAVARVFTQVNCTKGTILGRAVGRWVWEGTM